MADLLMEIEAQIAGAKASAVKQNVGVIREIGDGGIFAARPTDIWRLCVAPTEAYTAAEAAGAELWYADWAGGLLWLGVDADEESARRLRGISAKFSGHATLMRASADLRSRLSVFELETPARSALTASVKAAFDPQRLFNPGRMVEGL
jgi:glycolate oxidase FAD binding subunit